MGNNIKDKKLCMLEVTGLSDKEPYIVLIHVHTLQKFPIHNREVNDKAISVINYLIIML